MLQFNTGIGSSDCGIFTDAMFLLLPVRLKTKLLPPLQIQPMQILSSQNGRAPVRVFNYRPPTIEAATMVPVTASPVEPRKPGE